MAEEQEEKEEKPVAAPAGGSKKKLLIIIVGVVLLLAGIGVPTAIFVLGKGDKAEEVESDAATNGEQLAAEGSSDEEELEDGEEAPGAIIPLDTFIVNLSGGKYIRAQIQIEFDEFEVPKKFYRKIVPLRDSIITLLTKRTQEELVTEKGKEKLREEIKEAIDTALRKAAVRRIYFTQFVIQ